LVCRWHVVKEVISNHIIGQFQTNYFVGLILKVMLSINFAGVVSKLSNHTTEFGSTRGLCLTNDLLISSGYDLDNGIGYINGMTTA
jgi:hypothetical protein